MRKQNELQSLIEYGIELFGWGLLAVYSYRSTIFKTVSGLTLTQSNWIFWGIWTVCILTALFFTPKAKRSFLLAFANICLPLGIYLVISYFPVYRTAFTVWLCIVFAVLLLYAVIVLAVNIGDIQQGKYAGKTGKFLAAVLHTGRMILCLGFFVILLVFFINLFTGRPLMDSDTVAADPKVNNQKIADNIETLLLLQEEEWEALTAQQRLDVLQTVANIEATYLGLPHELNVTAEVLDKTVLGHYDDSTHNIVVNVDVLFESSAADLVEVIAHEAYHAYEQRLVDLYTAVDGQSRNLLLFRRIEEYQNNFENYIDGDEDIFSYATQAIETDSSEYAFEAVADYYAAIEDHLLGLE